MSEENFASHYHQSVTAHATAQQLMETMNLHETIKLQIETSKKQTEASNIQTETMVKLTKWIYFLSIIMAATGVAQVVFAFVKFSPLFVF